MITGILSFIFLILSAFSCAQTPPKQVLNGFNAKFKNAKKVSWEQEEANEWEAEFISNGKETSTSFDLSGNWLETEADIRKNDLPVTVKSAIDKKYADYKIEEAATIESPNFSGYEIALKKGEINIEVQVTKYGELTVTKESSEEENDSD